MKKTVALLKKLTVGESPQASGASGAWQPIGNFFKGNWKGIVVILAVTLWFFWPMVTRIDSYSPGGDAMFNAWTLARNHHCLTGQGCSDYTDGNIYFPHEDTMLYSETQLSAGLLTLPLFWINDNPLFAYNVWTIASVFLGGFFMYLLAKYLSRGREMVSIAAGLIFAYAPFKMAAIFHLQNLSIFYLPLAVLLIFKYFDTRNKWYLPAIFVVLALQFHGSMYNMVFAAAAIAILLGGYAVFKLAKLKQVAIVAAIMLASLLTVVPLTLEYMRFSKETGASFSLKDQVLYSSSVIDYFLPFSGTTLGVVADALNPGKHNNGYNLDSYSYHGVVLYVIAGALLVIAFLRRKDRSGEAMKRFGVVASFSALALVGFVFSLGPLLKLKASAIYGVGGMDVSLATPYLLIDKFLPQLSFIRAVGRWSVLFLFALCCLLAYAAYYMATHAPQKKWYNKHVKIVGAIVIAVLFIELMPIRQVPMAAHDFNYNLQPPTVYQFVKDHPEINNIIVLRGDEDYPRAPIPTARAEDVLWSGYHNRNIYNGYSGYTPPNYFIDYGDYKDFEPNDIPKMKAVGLRYVIVDKMLSNNRPHLADNLRKNLSSKLYEDERYALYKL